MPRCAPSPRPIPNGSSGRERRPSWGSSAQPDDKPLPVTLTYWDLAFLKSLYATDNAYFARYQRSDMERVIQEELERSRSITPEE